jgi:hypothetical protein
MTHVVLDEHLRTQLNGLTAELDLVDEQGNLLGHFLPKEVYQKLYYAWLKTLGSDEELEVARHQTGGRPLSEIWQRLGRS